MNNIYGLDYIQGNDKQYQKDKKLYCTLSNKLNSSIRDDSSKMAALSVITQYLFQKRNVVSINKPSVSYCAEQTRLLPLRTLKFFPEIQAFLKNLNITCQPDEFDNAIIGKIDVFTQAIFISRDRKYFELKDFFFRLENCFTPLDLLFRGLFYARAKQNVGKIKWVILGIAITIIVLFILFRVT